jgi:hypothetical protein
VEANHDIGTTLYASSQNEEARVHKKKVMVQFMVVSVGKVNQIPHTNVIPPTFEGNDGDNVW